MGLRRNLCPNPKLDVNGTGYSSSPAGYARASTAAAAQVITWSGNSASSATSSRVVSNDAAMVSGDLWIVEVSIKDETISTPAGWTLISSAVVATSRRIYWFRKTHAGGGEASSHTFTFSGNASNSVITFAVRGWDTGTPIDTTVAYDSDTSGTSVTAPTRTSASDGAIAITSHHKMAISSSITMSLPAGMTSIATGAGTGATGHAYRVAFEALGPSGTVTGARTSTSSDSGNPWGASTLLIRSDTASTALAYDWAFTGVAAGDVNVARAAVTAGSAYVYSLDVEALASQSFAASVNYYNAPSGGTFIGNQAAVAQSSMITGDVQRIVYGPYTAISGATYAQFKLAGIDAGGVRVTAVRVSPSTGDLDSDSEYFDGDTAGADWDGTTGASTSSYRALVETFALDEDFSVVETADGPVYTDTATLGESLSGEATGTVTDAFTVSDGFLVASASYDDTRGRVRIEAFTFPELVDSMRVRSRVPGRTTYADVRGGLVPVLGGLAVRPVDDYEYAAGRTTEYLIQGLGADGAVLSQAVVVRVGTNDRPWIKFIAQPASNHKIDLMSWGALQRDSRTAVYEVQGRSDPIVVSDVHSSRQTTITVACHSVEDADQLDASLSQGLPCYLQVPAELQLPSMYITVGDYSWERPARRSHRSIFTIPITEIAAPPATLAGAFTTWADVLADYATWEDVVDTVVTWRELAA